VLPGYRDLGTGKLGGRSHGSCDWGHKSARFFQVEPGTKKKRPAMAAWSLEVSPEIRGLPPGQGQAKRRSGAGDNADRQATGGKGDDHRRRRNRSASRGMNSPGQTRHHRGARKERGGNGEDDGLAHVR